MRSFDKIQIDYLLGSRLLSDRFFRRYTKTIRMMSGIGKGSGFSRAIPKFHPEEFQILNKSTNSHFIFLIQFTSPVGVIREIEIGMDRGMDLTKEWWLHKPIGSESPDEVLPDDRRLICNVRFTDEVSPEMHRVFHVENFGERYTLLSPMYIDRYYIWLTVFNTISKIQKRKEIVAYRE